MDIDQAIALISRQRKGQRMSWQEIHQQAGNGMLELRREGAPEERAQVPREAGGRCSRDKGSAGAMVTSRLLP